MLLVVVCYGVAILSAQISLLFKDGSYAGTACAFYQRISDSGACYAYAGTLRFGRDVIGFALTEINMLAATAGAICLLIAARFAIETVRIRLDVRATGAPGGAVSASRA